MKLDIPILDHVIMGRAPRGARGLKQIKQHTESLQKRRAPRGARGLKQPMQSIRRRCAVAPRAGRVD